MHARVPADTVGSSHSPRVKRRIRAKTSLAELERRERGRSRIPEPPRLRTLGRDPADIPISEGSLVPANSPSSGMQRAHPYTPVGAAIGSSSFELLPSARDRAASDRGLNESMETVPIVRSNSSPSIIQDPSQRGSAGFCGGPRDFPRVFGGSSMFMERRRTNVQQLTCNIDLSSSFYYLFFSFVLLELEPFVFKWKVLGEKFGKVPKSVKSVKNYETILPFSCCPLVFPRSWSK